MDIDLIWGGGEADYFFNEDWTGQITLKAFRKLVFARRAFLTKFLSGGSIDSRFTTSSGQSGNDPQQPLNTSSRRERRDPYGFR